MNTTPSDKNKPERVLVTGGGGFLGDSIVSRLVRRGDHVRSLARNLYPALEVLGVEQIRGDIGEAPAVDKACRDVDVVFHVAAKPPPWGKYTDYYQTNVVGTRNVIDACIQQQVSRLIYTSTPSVIFNGENLEGVDESFPYPAKYKAYYPATKAEAEQSVVKAAGRGLKTIILRPHEIWGPGDPHFVPRLLARAKKLKQIGDGRNLIDTIYIDNAADAHILAAEKLKDNPRLSGNIYFISQGEPMPAWDMINAVLKAAGYGPVQGKVPFRVAWLTGAALEFFYKAFRIAGEPQMTRFLAEAVAVSHWFNIDAAKKDLGYQPMVSTREGLKRLAEWLKNNTAIGAAK
ncbi:MAG: NAD-dependent epimerase/dehydratase family protein [Desulfobacterales bacterium]